MAKPKFIVLERELLDSAAYREMTSTAKDAYMRFLGKRQFAKLKTPKRGNQYTITNNGEICFTYTEAGEMGISRATFARCLDDLVERGFIDIFHSGSGGVKGDMSLYAISERWREFGTPGFIAAHRHKDLRQGESLRRYHQEKKHKYQS